MPAIRIIAESIPSECVVEQQIEAGIDAVLENIIAGLTRPLTLEEKAPGVQEAGDLSRIVFKGTLKKKGWG